MPQTANFAQFIALVRFALIAFETHLIAQKPLIILRCVTVAILTLSALKTQPIPLRIIFEFFLVQIWHTLFVKVSLT